MKTIIFIISVLIVISCESDKNKERIINSPWQQDEAKLPRNVETIEKDSFEISRENMIAQLETKRDKTLVIINKIEYDLRENATEEVKEAVASLNKKQKIITRKIEQLKMASKQTIEELKIGIDSALVDLERAIEKVKLKFKKDK